MVRASMREYPRGAALAPAENTGAWCPDIAMRRTLLDRTLLLTTNTSECNDPERRCQCCGSTETAPLVKSSPNNRLRSARSGHWNLQHRLPENCHWAVRWHPLE